MTDLHLDFETFSEVDLRKVGAYRYLSDPSTEILMAAYHAEGVMYFWDATLGTPPPENLLSYLQDPTVTIHAFNAAFERLVMHYLLGIELPPERFRCSMVHAWSLSFAGGLSEVGAALGLSPDKQKMAEGRRLINKFCKPAPKGHRESRYTAANSPEDWRVFCQYCLQDVVSEMEIERQLSLYPMLERELGYWCLDQRINDRGLPLDMSLVESACRLDKEADERLRAYLAEQTGLDNPASNTQMAQWLYAQGVSVANMQKETLVALLHDEKIPPEIASVIEAKLLLAQAANKKWHSLKDAQVEGAVHGTLQFLGAQRTGRWSGRLFQPQNIKQGRKDADIVAGDVVDACYEDIETGYGDVKTFLSEIVRTAITAPDGETLVISDLSSIESRVLGWLSQCGRINRIFRDKLDTYKDFACEVFKVLYEEVTPEQRKFAKPPTLGCGYGLGAGGLVSYARGYGVPLTEDEAKDIVTLYRSVYPEVPKLWRWLQDVCVAVTLQGGSYEGYGLTITRDDQFLTITLPSSRRLYYHHPLAALVDPPWSNARLAELEQELEEMGCERDVVASRLREEKERLKVWQFSYMGQDQYTRKWARISTHGGKLTENIVQAIARDLLADWMARVEWEYPKIVLTVHDEIVTLVNTQEKEEALLRINNLASITPEWAPGLILEAEGFTSKRYRKD